MNLREREKKRQRVQGKSLISIFFCFHAIIFWNILCHIIFSGIGIPRKKLFKHSKNRFSSENQRLCEKEIANTSASRRNSADKLDLMQTKCYEIKFICVNLGLYAWSESRWSSRVNQGQASSKLRPHSMNIALLLGPWLAKMHWDKLTK